MKLKDLKDTVLTIAPSIAGLLGGPLAQTAVSKLSKAFLDKEDGTEEEIYEAIKSANPEVLTKLKEIEAETVIELKRLEIDLEKINASDRDSARKRQVAMKDWTPNILGFIFIGGYFFLLYAILTGKVDIADGLRDIVILLLGILAAGVERIMNFFFGSSSGSKSKTAAMTKAFKS